MADDFPCTGEPAVDSVATVVIALPTDSAAFLGEWIVRKVPMQAVDFYSTDRPTPQGA